MGQRPRHEIRSVKHRGSPLLGVLGHPIGHSQSPALFERILREAGRADVTYRAFDLADISEFPSLVASHPTLEGLNVTVPYKQRILPFLKGLSDEARQLGAVNTLVREGDGWVGHNTDVWGFQRSIQPFLANRHERALVLGTGGSAAAVHHVLAGLGIEALSVSRKGDSHAGTTAFGRPTLGYAEVNELVLKHHLLVVHCTPVGMSPRAEEMVPFPVDLLSPEHLVVDLVYNPEETMLLKGARLRGAAGLNGADMLRLQAEKAWEIWTEAGI